MSGAHRLDNMHLINVKAFLKREQMMSQRKQVDRRTKVLELRDDEATGYAILSHRWTDPTEVNYEEMVDLAKMEVEERDEIRQRRGYKKILDTCELAKRDECEWVWVDTCCIDKRSSADLSEAINSMYRWYANSRVCYAYLHDVYGPSLPTDKDDTEYPKSNGWPEWFSRGWTLQEMIAPSNVQFFNSDWKNIGNKEMLAPTLMHITQVPEHVLKEGLSGSRSCVAQIMSWAASRRTTRVEDRAYSLMGLLNVNMPMLYGEGKKAFHRLQLEIIHTSNDQSIFAWGHDTLNGRNGSILADDPSSFRDCSNIELLEDHDRFIDSLKESIPEIELPSIDPDCFGTFPITNRGIQIWMLLRPYRDSETVFKVYLPCRRWGKMVTIDLVLWYSNFYRYSQVFKFSNEDSLHFDQVYLRYQDIPSNVTFEIDDNAVTENGFTCSDEYPLRGDALTLAATSPTLTTTSPICVRSYFDRQDHRCFAVVFGQCFGQDWIHLINDPLDEFSRYNTGDLLVKGPDRSRSMADVPSRRDCRGRIWVHYMRVPGSTWIVRTRRVVWERSRIGVQIEVFQGSHFRNGLDSWRTFNIEVSGFLAVCMQYYEHS